MSALDQQVAAILADPLGPARAADRAIGFVGLEMPDDLLAASGRYAVHLPWSIERPTPRSSQRRDAMPRCPSAMASSLKMASLSPPAPIESSSRSWAPDPVMKTTPGSLPPWGPPPS